jgi:uncharacterized RDD family membrane protein YckC
MKVTLILILQAPSLLHLLVSMEDLMVITVDFMVPMVDTLAIGGLTLRDVAEDVINISSVHVLIRFHLRLTLVFLVLALTFLHVKFALRKVM